MDPVIFQSGILPECHNVFLVNYLWPKCSVIIFVKFPVNINQHFLLAICKTLFAQNLTDAEINAS